MAYTASLPATRTGATPGTISIAPDVDLFTAAIGELRTKAAEADPAAKYDITRTTNQSVTSSTTVANDDTLTFPVASSEVWDVETILFCDGDAAGDIKVSVAFPAGATVRGGAYGLASGAGGPSGSQVWATYTAAAFIESFGTLGVGTPSHVRFSLRLTNSTTAGNFTVQWAQGTSSVTATRVLTGSNLLAIRQ